MSIVEARLSSLSVKEVILSITTFGVSTIEDPESSNLAQLLAKEAMRPSITSSRAAKAAEVAVSLLTASRRASTCGEAVAGEASRGAAVLGGGGGGGDRIRELDRGLGQPCQTLTPDSWQRGHFHFDV
ncbi:hypothetical protein E2C01_094796 [Portunus trituberculatus]|uniref:Uncharacterized protein n=1 Tax=Portunus trituberculatus TaxID=210409 RepID=A0A5B7JXV3_PORTR|nr:hypothetical protein [Portunus trituberculatus]